MASWLDAKIGKRANRKKTQPKETSDSLIRQREQDSNKRNCRNIQIQKISANTNFGKSTISNGKHSKLLTNLNKKTII